MDFIDLLPAARGLLKWSQSDLAEASGVGQASIARIENRSTEPQMATVGKLKTSLEAQGVEFLSDGVRLSQNPVSVIEGDDCYIKMLKDALSSLKAGDEILFSAADDRKSSDTVNRLMQDCEDRGITTRFLIEEGNDFILGASSQYRTVPGDYFAKHDVTVIWLDKVAFYIPSNPPRVMIIRNSYVANDYRGIFNYFWDHGKTPGSRN